MTESQKELHKALAAFQAEAPAIGKGLINQFGKYKYADLVEYLKVLKPLAAKHGLLVTQRTRITPNGGEMHTVLVTKVVHIETGANDDMEMLLPPVEHKGMSPEQAMGSSISYYRKYAWAMLAQTSHSEDPDALSPPEPGAPMEDLREFFNWLETARDYQKAVEAVKGWVHKLKDSADDESLDDLKKRWEARKKIIGPKRQGNQRLKDVLDTEKMVLREEK